MFGLHRIPTGKTLSLTVVLATALLCPNSPCLAMFGQGNASKSKAQPQSFTVLPAISTSIAQEPQSADQIARAIKAARESIAENPDDASLHAKLGDLLKKSGRIREATMEYLEASSLNRGVYVVYHNLSQTTSDPILLSEAIERLNSWKNDHPRDLMLRVALSELYEKSKDYHDAAKALIDLAFSNELPKQYAPRVEARIHFLLTKAKEIEQKEPDKPIASDEDLDVVPSPVPDASLRKGLTASKIKDSKELKGMGHVPLLP